MERSGPQKFVRPKEGPETERTVVEARQFSRRERMISTRQQMSLGCGEKEFANLRDHKYAAK